MTTDDRILDILRDENAINTVRAHAADLRYWDAWAKVRTGQELAFPVDPGLVSEFIADHWVGMPPEIDQRLVDMGVKRGLGTHSLNTIERRLYSLSREHEIRKATNPVRTDDVRKLIKSCRHNAARTGRTAQKKNALRGPVLQVVLNTCREDGSLRGIRDEALLLFAFYTGGRRRSEVATARVEDLHCTREGFNYTLPRSKTDQEGKGLDLPLMEPRAVNAMRRWLAASGITDGALFRGIRKNGALMDGISASTVACIIKRRVQQADLDPADYSGHSLRHGFMTEAGRLGLSLPDAMYMSGHKNVKIAIEYHRAGQVIRQSSAKLAGKTGED